MVFFKKKPQVEHAIICVDIGATAIKAGVFGFSKDSIELLGSGLVIQAQDNIESGLILDLTETIKCIQEAVKKAENIAKISPQELIFGVSGEMARAESVRIRLDRENTTSPIDLQELKNILFETHWDSYDMIRRRLADELNLPEIELKLVNTCVRSLQLDGQKINDLRGHSGKSIQVELYQCFSPLQHYGQLQNLAVELPFHQLKGIFVLSHAIAHALCLKHLLLNAIVIDIGAATTDITVVEDGHILGSRSYSLAGDMITKRISHELHTSFDEAEAIKINYSEKTLEKNAEKVIFESLQADLDIWLTSLEFALKEIPIKQLPNQIFITGNSSLLEEFKQALREHPWHKSFPFQGSMTVTPLEYHHLMETLQETKDYSLDFLALIALAITTQDLLYGNPRVDAILHALISDKNQ